MFYITPEQALRAGYLKYFSPNSIGKEKRLTKSLSVVAEPVWIFASLFAKISMMFMLLRFKSERRWKIGLISVATILTATIFGLSTALFFRCTPQRALWDPTIPNAKCWDPNVAQHFIWAVSSKVAHNEK
jgi:hypothetical protein